MKYIPYARQCIYQDDIKAVADTLKSDYLTQGPKVSAFERKVADYCGARYAIALNSGTSALHAACFAAGIKRKDQVITSPISFAASANCVLYCGGKPVFADILEDTVTIDPDEIAKRINRRTKAIIPVDFAGHPAELGEIKAVAAKYNLVVIEDAAHALGAEYKGTKIGCCKYSDMTILSFHAVKHITTGEGGMVLTDSKHLYDKLVMFRSHGITRDVRLLKNKARGSWFYEMHFLGFNYRMTDIQCALGLSQMKKLNRFVMRRKSIAEIYKKEFKNIRKITCLSERKYAVSSWHIFPIRISSNKEMAFNRLRAGGIGVNVHYIPIYLHPFYRQLGYRQGLCPKAEKYYTETITLPLYPAMSHAKVERVVRLTKDIVHNL